MKENSKTLMESADNREDCLTGSTSFAEDADMNSEDLERFVDGIWEPPIVVNPTTECTGDSCPIDFGGGKDEQSNI